MPWIGRFHQVSHFLASDCCPQSHHNTSSALPCVDSWQWVLCHHWGKLQILVPFEKQSNENSGIQVHKLH